MTSNKEFSATAVEVNFRDNLPRLMAAAKELGGITLRVVDDPDEAMALLRAKYVALTRSMYPDTSEEACEKSAAIRWSEKSVKEIVHPNSEHVVIETVFSEEHSLRDLHVTATHGQTHGHTQVS
jgi:hypothetical protein